ncbi:MAG: hypothetical protein V1766_11125 [Pseudomonadota bacterium]
MSKSIQGLLILLLLFAIFGCGEGVTSGDPLGTDSITVAASPATVIAGQESVITATVARLDKTPATDRSVSFSLRTNNSGGTLRVVNAKVDGQSKAVAIYTAGSNSLADEVTDTVQASLSNGAAAAVVIKRSKSAAAFSITVSADPGDLTDATGNSVVTANVKNNFGNAASGVKVTFAVTGGVAGTVHPAEATTDGSGNAATVYTGDAGGLTGQTSAVTASITVDGSTYTASTIITYP